MAKSTRVVGPGLFLNTGSKTRHRLIAQYLEQFTHMALKALDMHGLGNNEFVLMLAHSHWRDVVSAMLKETSWHARTHPNEPMVYVQGEYLIGISPFKICNVIADKLPALRSILTEAPSQGRVKVIAVDRDGVNIYDHDPYVYVRSFE